MAESEVCKACQGGSEHRILLMPSEFYQTNNFIIEARPKIKI